MNPFGVFGGETYTRPTRKPPSWINIEGGIGLFGGMYAGLLAFGVSNPVVLALTAGGALLGGAVGRARMAEERKHGRTIHSPSFFNKSLIAGALVGLCCATVLVPLVFTGFPILAATAFASLVVAGSIIGSTSEYFKQRETFARARERHEIQRMKDVERELGLKEERQKEHSMFKEEELPEFKDKPKDNKIAKWTEKNPAKAKGERIDFRSQVGVHSGTVKGGIA